MTLLTGEFFPEVGGVGKRLQARHVGPGQQFLLGDA
jgi:hypothetical protein